MTYDVIRLVCSHKGDGSPLVIDQYRPQTEGERARQEAHRRITEAYFQQVPESDRDEDHFNDVHSANIDRIAAEIAEAGALPVAGWLWKGAPLWGGQVRAMPSKWRVGQQREVLAKRGVPWVSVPYVESGSLEWSGIPSPTQAHSSQRYSCTCGMKSEVNLGKLQRLLAYIVKSDRRSIELATLSALVRGMSAV